MDYKKAKAVYEGELQQLRDKMSIAYTEYYSPKGICSRCGKQFTFITSTSPLLCAECLLSKLK